MTRKEKRALKEFMDLCDLAYETRDAGIFSVPEWVWDEIDRRRIIISKILEKAKAP